MVAAAAAAAKSIAGTNDRNYLAAIVRPFSYYVGLRHSLKVTVDIAIALRASGTFRGVQAARGIAALMVVIYHATRSLSLPQYLGHIPFGNAFGFGHAGVDFFFVLSGFIITHAHVADVGRPGRLCRYLWRRITRIYPIYWLATGIEVMRAIFASDAAIRLAPSHLLHSLLLLPDSIEPLVGVAWTLVSEMLFYVVFALTIIERRFCKPLIIATFLLIVAGVVAAPADPWLGLLVSPYNIEFLVGIGAAKLLAHRQVPCPVLFIAVGIIFFFVVGASEVLGVVPLNGLIGRMLYGSASAAILLGLVEAERRGSIRFGTAGSMLGDASFCLYLLHLTIIPLIIRGSARFGLLPMLPVSVVVAALVALALGVAVAVHIGVELPIMKFIRGRTPRAFR